LRPLLIQLKGSVLDVGCGQATYKDLLTGAERYVGLETDTDSGADIIIKPGEPWPISDKNFDNIIALQVLEHVDDINIVIGEISRVIKPQGTLIISIPFLYNEHGSPDDYRRLTVRGLHALLEKDYDGFEITKIGGIGTTLTILLLNFCIKYKPTRAIIPFVLPIWLVVCLVLNVIAIILDKADNTQLFYNNIVLKAQRRD
jgi:SAM-dependent methyltransferase